MRYYADDAGSYLGGFTDDVPADEIAARLPAGAVEVPVAPDHALKRWNGTTWAPTPALAAAQARECLVASDMDMARAAEDIIAALIAKGVLADADLPQALRDKIAARAEDRAIAAA